MQLSPRSKVCICYSMAESVVESSVVPFQPPPAKNPIVRVCNISGYATERQVRQLLEILGHLVEFVLYPSDKSVPANTKVAYARWSDPDAHKCAIHLNNTSFLDRVLILVLLTTDKIPDESFAISSATNLASMDSNQVVVGGLVLNPGAPLSLNFGFPYVPLPQILPEGYTAKEQSEARKTVFVYNIHMDVTAEVLLTLFSGVGEIRYVRIYEDKTKGFKCGFVEYSDTSSVPAALQFHEFPLFDVPLRLSFSRVCIDKGEKRPRRSDSSTRSPIRRARTFATFGPPKFTRSVVPSPPRRNYSTSSDEAPKRREPAPRRRTPSSEDDRDSRLNSRHRRRSRSRERRRRRSSSRESHRRKRSDSRERSHKKNEKSGKRKSRKKSSSTSSSSPKRKSRRSKRRNRSDSSS